MKKLLLVVLLVLPSLAGAAGSSVTWTKELGSQAGAAPTWIYSASVLSDDAAGTASGSVTMHGYIVKLVTNPGATAPTDDYDCVLTDTDGADVLGGALGNRDTANTEQAYPLDQNGSAVFARVDGSLTLSCSNMGNAKGTEVRVYVQE